MTPLLVPFYTFPELSYVMDVVNQKIVICTHEMFFKQTSRNRYYIATSNGKLVLSIPLIGSKNKRMFAEMEICYKENWQKNHLKSIETAYKHAPYYEFMEQELRLLFSHQHRFLSDFNRAAFHFLLKEFNLPFADTYFLNDVETIQPTMQYPTEPKYIKPYIQPFSDRTGFLEGMCGLDTLFCLGRNVQ